MPGIKKKRPEKPFGALVRSRKSLQSTFDKKMELKARRQHLKQVSDDKKESVRKAKEVNIHQNLVFIDN